MEFRVHAWRLVAGLLLLAVVVVMPISHADAYPRIDKTEALPYGDNLEPLGDNDTSGVGSLDRDSCVPAGEPGSVPGFDKDISCDDLFAPDNEMAIVAP